MKEFELTTKKPEELVDITSQINEIVAQSKIKQGICNVFVPHATAAITINENADPNITLDILDALDNLVKKGVWRHDQIDGNAHAHIKAAIVGSSRTIPISQSRLALGRWQDIFFCEFDGPRSSRKVIITVIEDK